MAANTKIQFRRGYSVSYTGVAITDPISGVSRPTGLNDGFRWNNTIKLAEGEIGYEIDTGKFKIGRMSDGDLLTWVNLPYAGGSELKAGSGIGLAKNENDNSYTIYSSLINDLNDNNITITSAPMSELLPGVPNITGFYYKLGLADNLSNIKDVSISGNLSGASGTFTGNVGITGQLTTQGNIISGGVNLTSIVNRLVPPQPPVFPGNQTLSLSTTNASKILCTGFVINNNSNSSMPTNGATASSVIFTSPYLTNNITGVGPGTEGTVSVTKNTASAGSRIMTTGNDNGTYTDLVISNDQDYSVINTAVASGFWQSFNARASGTSAAGWNTVSLSSDRGSSTNTISWYFDNSTQAPVITSPSVATGVGSLLYSSSVPHYSGTFNINFNVQYLSSDTYTDNFINAITTTTNHPVTSIGAITRPTAGLPSVLGRNYASTAVGVSIANALSPRNNFFASVATGNFMPNIVVNNSYTTTSSAIGPASTILIKTVSGQNPSFLQEDNIPVGNVVALGSTTGYGMRISGYNFGDTPTAAITPVNWNSTNPLTSGDAAVVGGVLSHNITNYTSFIPAGPNLSSSSRSNLVSQYFTFKVTRSAISQLDIRITANGIAGLWVRLPGVTDSLLSATNGWANATQIYDATNKFTNTTTGCARDAVLPLNQTLSGASHFITFGTLSSTDSTNNEIHIRVKLDNGQSISSLSVQGTT